MGSPFPSSLMICQVKNPFLLLDFCQCNKLEVFEKKSIIIKFGHFYSNQRKILHIKCRDLILKCSTFQSGSFAVMFLIQCHSTSELCLWDVDDGLCIQTNFIPGAHTNLLVCLRTSFVTFIIL